MSHPWQVCGTVGCLQRGWRYVSSRKFCEACGQKPTATLTRCCDLEGSADTGYCRECGTKKAIYAPS